MGVDTSVLYLMRGGKPMKKIIAIILVITMLACNSVNAASFVQDKKVELKNEHMKDYNNSSVKWKFDEKSSVLSFSGCEKLEKVDVGQIKNQVRYIVLADDIKEISSGSLSGYFNLSKVTILGDVVATGNAFYLDTPRTLELAGKCENLGEMISSDMAPFPKIVLINNNKYYEEKDRMLLTKDGKELVLFYGGESLKVPDTVEKIDSYACYQLGNLSDVKLNDKLKEIGDYAFYHTGISTLKLKNNIQIIGEQAFAGNNIKTVKFNKKIKLIGKYCFDDNLLRKVYLRSNPRLEEGAFPKDAVIQYSKKAKNKGSVAELGYKVKTKKLYVVANKIKKASGYQIVVTQKSNKLKKKFNTKKGELNKKLKLNLKYQVQEGVIKVNSRNSIYVKVRPYFGKKNNKKYGKWSIKYKVPVYK